MGLGVGLLATGLMVVGTSGGFVGLGFGCLLIRFVFSGGGFGVAMGILAAGLGLSVGSWFNGWVVASLV